MTSKTKQGTWIFKHCHATQFQTIFKQKWTNPGRQVTVATKFGMVVRNIWYDHKLCILLNVKLSRRLEFWCVPLTLKKMCLLYFWKMWPPPPSVWKMCFPWLLENVSPFAFWKMCPPDFLKMRVPRHLENVRPPYFCKMWAPLTFENVGFPDLWKTSVPLNLRTTKINNC
jgi:hypothetical protein